MDLVAARTAFDEQVRTLGQSPDAVVEIDGPVVRSLSPGGGWTGVVRSRLDDSTAEAVIAQQCARFADWGGPWEWKLYSHDHPADLADRLRAAGFVAEPPETLLVAELTELDAHPAPPEVELREVDSEDDIAALVAVHDEVFGGDNTHLGEQLRTELRRSTPGMRGAIAWAGRRPVAAGRVEFHEGTDFASIWGGGTVAEWRGRGVFRALVSYRAALAARRGFRYLQVDAVAASRRILVDCGFVECAVTIPFQHAGN